MNKLDALAAELNKLEVRSSFFADKNKKGEALTDDETVELRGLSKSIQKVESDIEVERALQEAEKRSADAEFRKQNPNYQHRGGTPKSDVEKLFEHYSVTRAAQFAAGDIDSKDAVAEREVHDESKKIAQRLGLPTTGKGMLIMSRSDFATALDAGNLGKTVVENAIQGYQKQIFADKIGAKMYMGLTGITKIPISDTTAVAGYVAENGSFGAVAANVRTESLTPKAILAKSTNGWYLKANAGSESDRILLDNLLKAEVNAVNANIIKTIGAGPTGAFDDADITDVTSTNGQALARALLITMKNSAAVNDAGGASPAWIISPTLLGRLENLAIDAGSGLFVMNADRPGLLMGSPVHTTTFMPINLAKGSGTNLQGALFGYWDNLAVANWAIREIIVDKSSSDIGVVTKIVSFYDHAYCNPKAFAKAYFTAS